MESSGEYTHQGEPGRAERAGIWRAAIGLQQVDNLTPSGYLLDIARKNIEGGLSVDEACETVTDHYRDRPATAPRERGEREADTVSARIARLLATDFFSFAPGGLLSIHGALFAGLLDAGLTGRVRPYDIRKAEPVLNGESVLYCPAYSLTATLEYDFTREKRCDCARLSPQERARHVADFISGVWQIHPFAEGNTRTVAVFAIGYLKTLGLHADLDVFANHAKYFRNALVRANFRNHAGTIPSATDFLYRFFGNLLLGENNRLDNRDTYIHPEAAPRD